MVFQQVALWTHIRRHKTCVKQYGVYLSDDDIDWIETVANEEEPT
ncbi:hypothetical protein [Cryobacterium sp. Y82]|nr:hypothetical protein [Cryobacterium sp. Y82]